MPNRFLMKKEAILNTLEPRKPDIIRISIISGKLTIPSSNRYQLRKKPKKPEEITSHSKKLNLILLTILYSSAYLSKAPPQEANKVIRIKDKSNSSGSMINSLNEVIDA